MFLMIRVTKYQCRSHNASCNRGSISRIMPNSHVDATRRGRNRDDSFGPMAHLIIISLYGNNHSSQSQTEIHRHP